MRSTEPIRPSSRRGASGAWNRLKPVREDVLETYGLPSKGETRLNDFKTQQTYLNRITERYMKLCALNREELDSLFASASHTALTTNDQTPYSSIPPTTTTTTTKPGLASSKYAPQDPSSAPTQPPQDPQPQPRPHPSLTELSTVLHSLRKLREAITATNRTDPFAKRAYYFAIHVAILCHDWASYVPALQTLLNNIHTRSPLPAHDLRHFVALHILDQTCRQGDHAGARETKVRYGFREWRVESVMAAMVRDDWVLFWRMRRGVDGYQRAVMQWGDGRVRVHALKCLGRSYLGVERGFVERVCERGWGELVGDGVGKVKGKGG
ncbi:hypothetical protein GQ44DRAFT_753189 [Phaeosphaeriaceae sp. PMI808]|nr:hypothetical protein GQ44DRAFT_753189 [Phaeosphaeriaceae sp. PMI808]